MTAIDWTRDDVQHIVATLDGVEIYASPVEALYAALDRLPPPTRRQRTRMWLGDLAEQLRRFPS